MREASSILLWRRYLDFVWLFDEVPHRADPLQRAAIMRDNRDRGLRFLPVYIRRYLRILVALFGAGTGSEAMAAPVAAGACFTLSTVVSIALVVAAIGFASMRWRAFGHRD
ncbi:MAG: hypothetical protein AB7P21_09810 [Lautropia sp.]